jgi:hypothetical protein
VVGFSFLDVWIVVLEEILRNSHRECELLVAWGGEEILLWASILHLVGKWIGNLGALGIGLSLLLIGTYETNRGREKYEKQEKKLNVKKRGREKVWT